MAKKTISGTNVGLVGTSTLNYIKQINDGTTTHDLAVNNPIKFFNGNDGDAIEWDGTQAIEVVIPSVTDIIQDPVRLVGTVGSDGNLPAGLTPAKGDLVYITADCTFQSQACEAGDMAIYDGLAWHVIQGENQVAISAAGATTEGNNIIHTLGTTPVEVLDVEGKALKLAVSYPTHTVVFNSEANTINVANGTTTVAATYVGLSSTTGTSTDIATTVSIDLPTGLTSDAVTIDSVLQASDFTFNSGALPSVSKESVTVNASHNMTIAASGNGDFVTAVTAISAITFGEGSDVNKDFGFIASLSEKDGSSFVTDVHTYNSATDTAVAFTAWGQATVENSVFATGWNAEAASGDVVSSITVGNVTLDSNGSGILTGVDENGSAFVTGVDFGSVVSNASAWFVSGLTDGSQVVTDVTVGAVSFVDGNSTYASNAIVSASVSDHVLSFNTGSFMKPVSLSKADDTITKTGFTKAGVAIDGATYTSAGFTTASLSQAATSVSFKSLATANLGLSQDSVSYAVSTSKAHDYEGVMGYVKATPVAATVTKNGAVLENTAITASISADTVVTGFNAGSLPSFSVGTPTGTITGALADSTFTTSNVSWLGVAEAKRNVAGATTYTLVEDSTVDAGHVEVAKASTYNLADADITIPANTYAVDVTVVNPS